MTDAQTEARAIALEPLNDLARKKDLFIDNAATASQTDFDEVTREAIELNVIAPLILALSERDTALAAKDAELAAQLAETQRAWNERDGEKRLRLRAEAALAEVRKALDALQVFAFWFRAYPEFIPAIEFMDEVVSDREAALPFIPSARRAREQGGENNG